MLRLPGKLKVRKESVGLGCFERALKTSFAIDKLRPCLVYSGAGTQGPLRIPVKLTPTEFETRAEEGDEGDEWCFQEKYAVIEFAKKSRRFCSRIPQRYVTVSQSEGGR